MNGQTGSNSYVAEDNNIVNQVEDKGKEAPVNLNMEPQKKKQTNKGGSQMKTAKLVKMAVLVAISVVLVYLVHFPIFPPAPYLEYDPADIPIFIGTFAFGPLAGFVLTVIVSVIQGVTVSTGGQIWGIIMHIMATGIFAIVAGNIYKYNKTKKGAIIALALGVVCMVVMMCFANLLITPIYSGMPVEAVKAMILPIIMPFNLIKAGVNAIITLLLYKRISKFLHR